MEQYTNEPLAAPVLSKVEGLPATIRHACPEQGRRDGWTGEKMAIFCEALAETAVVAEACDKARMGISGAYAHRRRSAVFAAAWDAALAIARERLADTLLARSIEGNVEQVYRDGELVGERHVIDNRLGLAILRRLDRIAETGLAVSTIGQRAATLASAPRSAPACRAGAFDWDVALDALRTGDPDSVAQALGMFKGDKVEEVEGPPDSSGEGDSGEREIDLSDRCWKDDGIWITDFPPPPGFDGWESGEWGDTSYERTCTPEEVEILAADEATAQAGNRAGEEKLRDSWFAMLSRDRSDT